MVLNYTETGNVELHNLSLSAKISGEPDIWKVANTNDRSLDDPFATVIHKTNGGVRFCQTILEAATLRFISQINGLNNQQVIESISSRYYGVAT